MIMLEDEERFFIEFFVYFTQATEILRDLKGTSRSIIPCRAYPVFNYR
jgi:hypothetical protein